MDQVTHQIRRVQAFVRTKRGNKTRLANSAGLRSSTLTDCLDTDWYPNSKTLMKLVQALDELEENSVHLVTAA